MIFKFANRRYGLKYNPVNGVSLARKPKTNEEIKKKKMVIYQKKKFK